MSERFMLAFQDELEKLAKRKKKSTGHPSAFTSAHRGAALGAGAGALASLLGDKVPSYWSLPDRVSYRAGRATRHGLMGAALGGLGGLAIRHITRPEAKEKRK